MAFPMHNTPSQDYTLVTTPLPLVRNVDHECEVDPFNSCFGTPTTAITPYVRAKKYKVINIPDFVAQPAGKTIQEDLIVIPKRERLPSKYIRSPFLTWDEIRKKAKDTMSTKIFLAGHNPLAALTEEDEEFVQDLLYGPHSPNEGCIRIGQHIVSYSDFDDCLPEAWLDSDILNPLLVLMKNHECGYEHMFDQCYYTDGYFLSLLQGALKRFRR